MDAEHQGDTHMFDDLRDTVSRHLELYRTRAHAKTLLVKLETKRNELTSRLMEDQIKLHESWGKQSSDFELGYQQALNTQLRGGPDEKTAVALSTITDTMIPQSRKLYINNPFAQSAIANLQHYVIGSDGFQYRKKGKAEEKVVEYWNEWMLRVGWRDIELETLKRVIRDGEVCIRWFDDVPRFVEPKQIIGTTKWQWGIETDPRDGIILKNFFIAYTDQNTGLIDASQVESVPASQVQYLKWPLVDLNCIRGMPPLYFVAANLDGAARCLKNMRELVAVQTAIAIIREHVEGVSGTDIVAWQNTNTDNIEDPETNSTVFQKKFQSGTMLDVPHGQKIHFPAATMRADSYIEVVQADLRAVAASLGLPEFIFTANASSSNYASLMAAEGPAVKAFESIQGWLGRFFALSYNRVISIGAGDTKIGRQRLMKDFGTLPARTALLPTSVIGSGVRTGKQFEEARTRLIEAQAGVLSPQEWCNAAARDYDETMAEIEKHRVDHPDIPWPPTPPAQTVSAGPVPIALDPNAPLDPNGDIIAKPNAGNPKSTDKTTTGSQKRDAGGSGA